MILHRWTMRKLSQLAQIQIYDTSYMPISCSTSRGRCWHSAVWCDFVQNIVNVLLSGSLATTTPWYWYEAARTLSVCEIHGMSLRR